MRGLLHRLLMRSWERRRNNRDAGIDEVRCFQVYHVQICMVQFCGSMLSRHAMGWAPLSTTSHQASLFISVIDDNAFNVSRSGRTTCACRSPQVVLEVSKQHFCLGQVPELALGVHPYLCEPVGPVAGTV